MTDIEQTQKPLLFYCGAGGRSQYDKIALQEKWLTGIRSDKSQPNIPCAFVDNNWKQYDHSTHLNMVQYCRPHIATARDILQASDLLEILKEAEEISKYCDFVMLIPKAAIKLPSLNFPWLWGYSVPSSYGKCTLPPSFFGEDPVHLLGGSPSMQAELAKEMSIYSLDGNYAMNIARWGKSCWPGQSSIKVEEGCYESFRHSLRQQRLYWHSGNSKNHCNNSGKNAGAKCKWM